MVIDYEGYTYDFFEGKAGIHHHIGKLVDPQEFLGERGDPPFVGVKFVAWVTEEVSHCQDCKRENVVEGSPCFNASGGLFPYHRISKITRKREVEIWLTYDQAFALGLSLMRDFSLGRYGVG